MLYLAITIDGLKYTVYFECKTILKITLSQWTDFPLLSDKTKSTSSTIITKTIPMYS